MKFFFKGNIKEPFSNTWNFKWGYFSNESWESQFNQIKSSKTILRFFNFLNSGRRNKTEAFSKASHGQLGWGTVTSFTLSYIQLPKEYDSTHFPEDPDSLNKTINTRSMWAKNNMWLSLKDLYFLLQPILYLWKLNDVLCTQQKPIYSFLYNLPPVNGFLTYKLSVNEQLATWPLPKLGPNGLWSLSRRGWAA